MTAPASMLGLALALALAGCSGSSGDAMSPNPEPPEHDPGPPAPTQGGVQGSYVLEQINGSRLGQLVTISNPDGEVIGLYRFQPTTLLMDGLQNFTLELRYSDDQTPENVLSHHRPATARSGRFVTRTRRPVSCVPIPACELPQVVVPAR